MGNDGGSIPRRVELVKEKKKEEKVDSNIQAITKWFFCALSKQPLEQPIVADEMGRMYNRESVLEFLLDRENAFGDSDKICGHIRTIKDVVTLKLASVPTLTSKKAEAEAVVPPIKGKTSSFSRKHIELNGTSNYICPILGKEMNGKNKFVFLWTCGCVLSEDSLKIMTDNLCLNCSTPISNPDDIIQINPRNDQLISVIEQMKRHRQNRKSSKKRKNPEVAKIESCTGSNIERRDIQLNNEHDNMSGSTSTKVLEKNEQDVRIANKNKSKSKSHRRNDITNETVDPKRVKYESTSRANSGSKIHNSTGASASKRNKVLDSVFLSEKDHEKLNSNKNHLFRGTFNRYVS
ncbi:Protein RTF2-like protein [Zancudomyces culisetae]|uniref:Protein RTF2-like protein n=1 Tax=Zancudomyces culisetae TaxID=1213189 RepID=A0A1R1PKR9_ZANCU|nr:Protein RTF2-like protein [Zancudomyces culisetae]|eukprot:OMH81571.1 Protein RTF2-like protein [Zancudomyces culisetae]